MRIKVKNYTLYHSYLACSVSYMHLQDKFSYGVSNDVVKNQATFRLKHFLVTFYAIQLDNLLQTFLGF